MRVAPAGRQDTPEVVLGVSRLVAGQAPQIGECLAAMPSRHSHAAQPSTAAISLSSSRSSSAAAAMFTCWTVPGWSCRPHSPFAGFQGASDSAMWTISARVRSPDTVATQGPFLTQRCGQYPGSTTMWATDPA